MKIVNSRTLYYGLRILQRLSLLCAGLSTILYWVVIIDTAIGGTLAREQVGHQWRNATALNDAQRAAIDRLAWNAVATALAALALNLVLLVLPRVRKFEKRLVVDGVVIAVFCLLSTVLAVELLKTFIGHYIAQYPIAV